VEECLSNKITALPFVEYDEEFEYSGKVIHDDYDKGKYERIFAPKADIKL
jgi:hypothetical protein